MGLAERKDKQRIGHDPRNLTWSDDKTRFSYKHMSALGWSENSGLGGSDLSGNPNHITVARKLDNGGIGVGRAKKEGDDAASGAGMAGAGLDGLLKRLAEAASKSESSSGATTPTETVEITTPVVPARNRIASRQKHLVSKRLASQSPAALAEILGVSVASLTASPTPSESSTPVTEIIGDPARTAEETTSTSTQSVADYFRQKLREKALARHAASGASSELPEHSLARVKEEVKVEVGGVTWEGSRVTFGEVDVKPDIKPDIKPTIEEKPDIKPTTSELAAVVDVKPSKEERRRAKEEKRRLKEEKRARKAAALGAPESSEQTVVKAELVDAAVPKKEKRKRETDADRPAGKRDKTHT